MTRLSQKQIIFKYLKSITDNNGWVREYDLRSKMTPDGWIGFQGDRRVRELYKIGILERRQISGYAEYRYKHSIEIKSVPLFTQQNQQKLKV